ncbi:MAG: glycosyltransferase [Bacilli bacterium]|nr:glycosyltransferase [Bacilli bacterium]
MENIEISIIIPIYNSEKFLAECLDSIFSQSFLLPFEVIASINGSHDNSINILKEYQAKHDNLIILEEKENIGAAISRINGIKKARGKYIAFIDSDDLYHKDFLKVMHSYIEKGYDIVGCNYYHYKNGHSYRNVGSSFLTLDSVKATKALLIDFNMRGYMWNKLYRKDILISHSIYFPKTPGTLFEDVVTLYNILLSINTFKCITKPLYYYRKNNASVTSVKNKERFNQHLYAFSIIRYLCDQNPNKKYLKVFRHTYLRSWLSLWFDAYLLRKEFHHGPFKHLHLYKKELKALRNKKPLPVKGEVWEQYILDCLN